MRKLVFLALLFCSCSAAFSQEVEHTSGPGNLSGENTQLSIDVLYNNPKAIIVAIPLDETKKLLKYPVGVWNNGVNCYIFNEDRSPMKEGIKFRVIYSLQPDSANFLFQALDKTIKGDVAYIDRPVLNNNPNAVILGSMSENPSGVYNRSEIAFKYDEQEQKWFVYNVNKTPIPKDLGIYIIVQKPAAIVKTKMQVTKDTLPQVIRPILKTDSLVSNVPKDVDFPNWNFEKGLTGWTKEGTAFNNQPTFGDNVVTTRILTNMELSNGGVGGDYWKGQVYNIGRNGNNWIGTYENNPANGGRFFQTQGDAPTGVLTSDEFSITVNNCYFNIGGGADAQNLYVELQVKQADGVWSSAVKKTSFRNNELMYRERIDLTPYKGKTARIKIVDISNGNWGHINVDNFRFTNDVLDGITLRDNASGRNYEVDVNTPVWGIADTHAHPAHDLGFGKVLITGKATTPLSETYSNDLCITNHGALGTFVVRKPFIMGADPHLANGWPDFLDFPRFNSKTHQQQHVEFLKRAFDGGMRLFCALAINNMYVPSLFMGPGNDGTPFDDETVLMQQIDAITAMVNQNSSWMEIAKSPKDARRIILSGKMAIVLGLEADNLGNFKAASYNWIDKNAGSLFNNPLVTLTDANADQLIEAKMSDYYFRGIRQITPIHYLSGLFGGAAVFRAELAVQQAAFNNDVKVKSGVDKRIPFSLLSDFPFVIKFSNPPIVTKEGYSALVKNMGIQPINLSTINNLGLTNIGNKLIQRMMYHGFIIDGEHMGLETKDNVFSVAGARGYPIISSHTDPAGLSNTWTGAPTPFLDNGPKDNQISNMRNFGTTNIRNLANEFEMSDEHFAKISNSGGTVGVFMLPYLKKPYNGFLGTVANDCAGTSKTFAQMFLYSVDKMNLRGVGLATDRGMTDFIGPRFGPNSAYGLRDEQLISSRIEERKNQRLAQRNGVRYDVPVRNYFPSLYENLDMKSGLFNILDEIIVTYLEEDIWKALAAKEAGVSSAGAPLSREVLYAGRIKNFVDGMTISSLDDPLIKTTGFFEKAAMYCVLHNQEVTALPGYNIWLPTDKNYIMLLHNTITNVWLSWKSKNGNNEPLRRYITGNRYWDFNTDGMAHYGLMPDFLQDLRNIGVNPDALGILFRSAEDYIQMWEKTEKASGTGVPSQQTPVIQTPILKKPATGVIKLKKQ